MPRASTHRVTHVAARGPLETLIHVIRKHKIMLDSDLAALYEVPTRVLNQAVKRNASRFPEDFMFMLTREEVIALRSQTVISKGGRRYLPYAFTQEGVAMLSAVLGSGRAIQMSIDIMRAFVRLRQIIEYNEDIAARVERLERDQDRTGSVIEILVEDIDRLAHEVKEMKALPRVTKRKIGFRSGENEQP